MKFEYNIIGWGPQQLVSNCCGGLGLSNEAKQRLNKSRWYKFSPGPFAWWNTWKSCWDVAVIDVNVQHAVNVQVKEYTHATLITYQP